MTTYTITKRGNYGFISPIPDGKLAGALLKYMSYERQGKEFMPNPAWATVKLYNVKKGCFPWGFRGLVNKIFDKWCDIDSNDDYILDNKVNPLNHVYYRTDILRMYQWDAVRCLIDNNGGILNMPTGSGKTKTIIEYLKIMDKPAVVIVPTLDIKRQWEEQCQGTKIKVINYQSKNAELLIKKSNIIVFDECHHVSAKMIYKLAMQAQTDAIIVGCSASPTREDGEDMRIQAAIGEIVYSISRRELIDQGYLADADVLYLEPSFDCSQDRFMTYEDIYKKHIVENHDRNEKIIDMVKRCLNEKM